MHTFELTQLLPFGRVIDQHEAPILIVAATGARIVASRIRICTSSGIGSGLTRRMARVVYSASRISMPRVDHGSLP